MLRFLADVYCADMSTCVLGHNKSRGEPQHRRSTGWIEAQEEAADPWSPGLQIAAAACLLAVLLALVGSCVRLRCCCARSELRTLRPVNSVHCVQRLLSSETDYFVHGS